MNAHPALRRFILFLAVSCCALPARGQSAAPGSVTELEIRFDRVLSRTVALHWGVNGWQAPADSLLPPGTVRVAGHLETPFVNDGSISTLVLHLPAGDTLNWGVHAMAGERGRWLPQKSIVVTSDHGPVEVHEIGSLRSVSAGVATVLRRTAKEWLPFLVLAVILLVASVRRKGKGESAFSTESTIIRSDALSGLRVQSGLWIVSIVMLAGTAVFAWYFRDAIGSDWDRGGFVKYLLIQFDLTTENVFAVWFSSMLFLFAGLFPIVIACGYGSRPLAAKTICVLAGLGLIALSADEMGSLHERALMLISVWRGGDGSSLKLLVGTVGALIALPGFYFLLLLWRQSRSALVLFLLAVVCLASVPMQETLEIAAFNHAADQATFVRPIGLMVLEEGSELAAALLLIAAFGVVVAEGRGSGSAGIGARRVDGWLLLLGLIALAGVGVVVGRSVVDSIFLAGDKGNLGFWFPAACALVAALVARSAAVSLRAFDPAQSRVFGYLSWVALGVSAFYGSNLRLWGQSGDGPRVDSWVLVAIALIAVGLLVRWRMTRREAPLHDAPPSRFLGSRLDASMIVQGSLALAALSLVLIAVASPKDVVAADVLPSLFVVAASFGGSRLKE